MRVDFLLPKVGQPRYRKRIEALRAEGLNGKVMAFDRGSFAGNPYGDSLIQLGHVEHGRYFRRLLRSMLAIPRIRRETAGAEVVYCFNIDLLLLGWLATRFRKGRPKLVYEVGDVQNAQCAAGLVGAAMRRLEGFLCRRIDLMVVTSKRYVSMYYEGRLGLKRLRFIEIENKVEPELVGRRPAVQGSVEGRPIRIGYFGFLRCPSSMEILMDVARQGGGRFEVIFRGRFHNLPGIEEEIRSTSHVTYLGPYTVPGDLPCMYAGVDLVWAAAEWAADEEDNWRMARANRFYEACYFRKPMLVRAGAGDSWEVQELGVGVGVHTPDVSVATDQVLAIQSAEIDAWARRQGETPLEAGALTDEHQRLAAELVEIVGSATRPTARPTT